MRFPIQLARAALAAAALALPLKAAGCTGSTACIDVPQATYATKGCPTKAAAGTFFGGACAIASVDGEGSYDGEFCCYPVTQIGGEVDCGGVPGGVSGIGGGSFGPTTTQDASVGISGTGGFGASDVGVGPSSGTGGFFPDGGPPCASCSLALMEGVANVLICSAAAGSALMSLESCACSSCSMQCAATLCGPGGPLDGPCEDCLQTSCNMAFVDCANN